MGYVRHEKKDGNMISKFINRKKVYDIIEPARTLNSWVDGCKASVPNSGAEICEACKTVKDKHDKKMLCQSEPSNLALLHIFEKRQLKAPYARTTRATAIVDGQAVEPWSTTPSE